MMLEENDTTKKRICDGFPTIDVLPLLGSSTLKCVNTQEHINPRISLLIERCMKLRNAAVAVNKFLIIELLPDIVLYIC